MIGDKAKITRSKSARVFFDEKWLNKKYWINDIYGKVVVSGIVNSLQEKMNLENGLYILNTGYSSQKMIISSN